LAVRKKWLAAGAAAIAVLVVLALALVLQPKAGTGEVGVITVSDMVTSRTSGHFYEGVQVDFPYVSVRASYTVSGMPVTPYDSTNISSIEVKPGVYGVIIYPPSGYEARQSFLNVRVAAAGQVVPVVFFLDLVTNTSSSP